MSKQNFINIVKNKNFNPNVIKFLVESSIVDEYGKTILHYACRYGSMPMLELILSLNPTDKFICQKDIRGISALDEGCWKGHDDVVNLLLQATSNFDVDKALRITLKSNDSKKDSNVLCYDSIIKNLLINDASVSIVENSRYFLDCCFEAIEYADRVFKEGNEPDPSDEIFDKMVNARLAFLNRSPVTSSDNKKSAIYSESKYATEPKESFSYGSSLHIDSLRAKYQQSSRTLNIESTDIMKRKALSIDTNKPSPERNVIEKKEPCYFKVEQFWEDDVQYNQKLEVAPGGAFYSERGSLKPCISAGGSSDLMTKADTYVARLGNSGNETKGI